MNVATATAQIPKSLNADWSPAKTPRPVLLLTINNGAGHTRAAEAIASAWQSTNREIPTRIIEVSAFMSPLAHFTHVSAYLWLVKNAPRVWEKIDAYQKRQTQTSPEWFYRRECRKLFELVEQIQPVAIVATEVGCGEIAALIKRDLRLKIPLVAVNVNYDADRAWIQPETDFYCLRTATPFTILSRRNFLNAPKEITYLTARECLFSTFRCGIRHRVSVTATIV